MRCFLLMGVPCKVPLLKGHVSHCIDILRCSFFKTPVTFYGSRHAQSIAVENAHMCDTEDHQV